MDKTKTTGVKSEDIQVQDEGKYGIITSGSEVYSFEVIGSEKWAQPGILPFYTNARSLLPMRVGEFDIIPQGDQNLFPEELCDILAESNSVPELLNKKAQMLWGQGPCLYRTVFENGVRKRIWDTDAEIEAWLKSWNHEDFLLKKIVEYEAISGHNTKYFRNKGARIGKPAFISKLEHVSSVYARLEWPDKYNQINHIIVGDWLQPWSKGLRAYPIYSPSDSFANPVSMLYTNMYQFAMDNDYSRPSYFGTMGWIKLATSIAKLLSNFNKNSAAIKYHIKVAAIYWEAAEEELKKKAITDGVSYNTKMLVDFKKKKYQEFADILRGVENVGKFLTTEELFDETSGKYVGWTVDVLDQKVKDFIDAQVNIAKHALLETTVGVGLHPALSNISFDGNLPSGSEQLYAFKLYLLTGNDIPESIVCRDINNAIAANWPDKVFKIGFYHDAVITESETSPKDRVKNKTSNTEPS